MKALKLTGVVLVALLVGGATVATIESVNARQFPVPEGLSIYDRVAFSKWVSTLPSRAFLLLPVAWGTGCLAAGFAGRRLDEHRSATAGAIPWMILTAATVFNLFALPHPVWLWPAGVLACIVGGLWGLALASPASWTVECSRLIHSSADRVFRTLSTVEEFSKAIPEVSKIEFLSETRTGVGTRFRETRLMNGRTATAELEITEVVEHSLVRFVSMAGGTVWDSAFLLSKTDSAVEVRLVTVARPHNFTGKLLTPLFLGMIRKSLAKDLDAVKAYSERT